MASFSLRALASPRVLPWLLLLPAFLALYGAIPYTYSHLGAREQMVSVFHALGIMWKQFPDFQHGIIVPLLIGVIVFMRRQELATLPVRGWTPAIVLVALSLAVFWVGRRVDNQYLGFFSIQLLLGAFVLWHFGWRWLAALAFPIGFLVFAWPMPFLDNYVAFPLRMIMSAASVAVLNVFGVDAIRNGTAIVSAPAPELGLGPGGVFAVDVADPCSGIRSLFALMMVSALYGFFALPSPWKRLALFITSVPLAVAGNLARILLLTLGTIIMGPEVAIGTLEHPSFFHMLAGYAVFIVALGGMIAIATLLRARPSEMLASLRNVRSTFAAARERRPATPSSRASTEQAAADIY